MVKSFWVLQSPLALQLPSAERSAFLLEREKALQGLCTGARWELFKTGASGVVTTVDPGVHPPEVSGVGAHLGFQMWVPRQLIEVCAHRGALCLCAQAAEPPIWVHTDPRFWACAPPAVGPLIRLCTHLGFQLWAPILLIWVGTNQASGVCWGCLSLVHSPGAERGRGARGRGCCGEFSN